MMSSSGEKYNLFFEEHLGRENEEQCPVISRITKDLTSKRIKEKIGEVQSVSLPEEIKRWVERYEEVGRRKDFIWKWTYLKAEELTLTSVPENRRKEILVPKVLTIIINALIDDIADEKKDRGLLLDSMKIFFFSFSDEFLERTYAPEDKDYLHLIEEIKNAFFDKIKRYPGYRDFEELLFYDYRQFYNAALYGHLINEKKDVINLPEYKIYLSNNMQMMVLSTIDLMASSEIKREEIHKIREIFWKAQRMGRIGNSITTFKREIEEDDFTSEVFARMISRGVINADILDRKNHDYLLFKINEEGLIRERLLEGEENYHSIDKEEVNSFSIEKILRGLENLIEGHIISEGLK